MAITRPIGEKFQADDGTWLEVKEVYEIKYSFADEKDFYNLDYFKAYLYHMQVESVKLITSENKEVTLVVKSRKPLEFEVV